MNKKQVKSSEVLKQIRHLLTDPKNWTQGSSARDKAGRITDPLATDAVCWCLVGALIKVTRRDVVDDNHAYWAGLTGLHRVISFVPEFNDAPERKHSEILDKLDKAIKTADVLERRNI